MKLPANEKLTRTAEMNAKLSRIFQKRSELAREHFVQRVRSAHEEHTAQLLTEPMMAWNLWTNYYSYATDLAQRSILFWDTLRQRGNQFREHEQAGKPPVLHFDYEIILDARKFKHPANYALLRILPPEGVTI